MEIVQLIVRWAIIIQGYIYHMETGKVIAVNVLAARVIRVVGYC